MTLSYKFVKKPLFYKPTCYQLLLLYLSIKNTFFFSMPMRLRPNFMTWRLVSLNPTNNSKIVLVQTNLRECLVGWKTFSNR